jgi:hypothetical protein
MAGRTSIRLTRGNWKISSGTCPGESKPPQDHSGTPAGIGVTDPMKMMLTEDLNQEKLNWLIEHVDEMVSDLEEYENET